MCPACAAAPHADFNAPVQRCLDRLTDAKWSNSDILLVRPGGAAGMCLVQSLTQRASPNLWGAGCSARATVPPLPSNPQPSTPPPTPTPLPPPQVSDGELRQPGPAIMRKLSGAKDKLSLRVHGLIVGSPEKRRADPAVLRSLCSHTLPNGKNEVLVHEFESWASVQADRSMQFDWDDAGARRGGLGA